MPQRHTPVAPIGQHQPWHINAATTLSSVGLALDTTSTTVIAGGGAATTVTPVSMAGILQGKRLLIIGGLGTTEVVQPTAVTPTTFTAIFQNAHPTQAAPSAPSATGNTGTGSAFTASQTANVAISYVTAAGETTVSPNTLVTITTTGNNIVVTLPSFPAGVTGANVYISISSGSGTLMRVTAGTTSTTSGGTVTVTGFPTGNPSPPASNTSGQYHIISLTGTSIGSLVINTVGTTDQITLYNGSPNASGYSAKMGQVIGVIKPVAGASFIHTGTVDFGLFYAVAGSPVGDYTIWYLDQAGDVV